MDKLATFESVGKNHLLTFVDENGFITQVLLTGEDLQNLRDIIDDKKLVLKLGTATRTIPLRDEDREEKE